MTMQSPKCPSPGRPAELDSLSRNGVPKARPTARPDYPETPGRRHGRGTTRTKWVTAVSFPEVILLIAHLRSHHSRTISTLTPCEYLLPRLSSLMKSAQGSRLGHQEADPVHLP